jgi:hypothetical protein
MRPGVTVTMILDCVSNDASSSPCAIVNLPYRRSSGDSGATLHFDERCVHDILTRHGQPSAVMALCLAFLGGRRMGPNMQAVGKVGRATNG